MRKDSDSTDFWVHKDPQGQEFSYPTVWKTKLEPMYDENEHGFVCTPEARIEGDRLISLNSNAVSMLSMKVRENLNPGIKIHIVNGKCAEIKDIHDALTEPVKHLYDVEEHEDFEAVRDDNGIIFGLKGIATLHERKAFLITRRKNMSDVLRVDYVNQKGKIVRHDADIDVDEAYVELGKKDELYVPRTIGEFWSSDLDRQVTLSSMFVQSYLLGIRFQKPPVRNEIVIRLRYVDGRHIMLDTNGEYYGVGDNLLFSITNNFRADRNKGTRSLEGVIVNSIITYRWFFGKPNLKVNVVFVHDEDKEKKEAWSSLEEYEMYMRVVNINEDSIGASITELINTSVNAKWEKRKKNLSFNPSKISLYSRNILEETE